MDLSRNWLISDDTQKKIENCTLLLAGCGLGAVVAETAIRVGFRNFILIDGDRVELSNLNRPPFQRFHLQRNKAEVTEEIIHSINPEAKVEVIPHFLGPDEEMLRPLVERADIIVNTIDPDEALWRLEKVARHYEKPTLHPMNAGWYSFVFFSSPKDPPLEKLLGGKCYGFEFYQRLAALAPEISLPSHVMNKLDKLAKGELPVPQVAPVAMTTASLIVTTIIKWLENGKLDENPVVRKL